MDWLLIHGCLLELNTWRCSGITGGLKDDERFMCKRCKKMAVADDSDIEKVYLDGEAIEVVEKFCYLGDSIGARGGAGAGVMARVRRGWICQLYSLRVDLAALCPFAA
ncbi:hypothetical protein Pcinc_013851 [Petrolisthes cinctipes]|uniref:Uncharacterized protein n=1 Tax=Petrolisthes cinctipes TaxID=88211 RepID=A0AAE1FXT7_PETCI|nr:hypothetical protein Pcinc_013851 [Petrolisthes cinctipes]